jgi:hypothetical protein
MTETLQRLKPRFLWPLLSRLKPRPSRLRRFCGEGKPFLRAQQAAPLQRLAVPLQRDPTVLGTELLLGICGTQH